jgi:hypothetical protein
LVVFGGTAVGILLRGLSISALLALIGGAWVWYQFQRPPTVVVPADLVSAADVAVERFALALPRPERALRPVLVLPPVGDREMLVTQALRNCLDRQGLYRPVDKGRTDRFLEELYKLAGIPQGPVTDPAVALKLGRAAAAEVVLLGHVDRFWLGHKGAEIVLTLRMLQVADGQVLSSGTFSNTITPAPSAGSESEAGLRMTVLVALIALALLCPLLAVPLMRRTLRRESNAANLLTIVGISALPAVIAWPVAFRGPTSVWHTTLYLIGVVLSVLWSTTVMAYVAEGDS